MVKMAFYPDWMGACRYTFCSILRPGAQRLRPHIVHRATGNQPHHEFNAFAARFTHVVNVRNAGCRFRVVDQLVQKGVVKLLVNQPGSRPLQLVAHAAGAPNLHLQRLVE